MPVYQCATAMGSIDADQRRRIAEGVTTIHSEETKAPEPFIRVIFSELPRGYAYTAGEAADSVILNGSIRAGRSEEIRKRMFKRMHELLLEVTGVSEGQIVIALMDFPSRWGMEAGFLMPDPTPEAEAEWFETLEKAGVTP